MAPRQEIPLQSLVRNHVAGVGNNENQTQPYKYKFLSLGSCWHKVWIIEHVKWYLETVAPAWCWLITELPLPCFRPVSIIVRVPQFDFDTNTLISIGKNINVLEVAFNKENSVNSLQLISKHGSCDFDKSTLLLANNSKQFYLCIVGKRVLQSKVTRAQTLWKFKNPSNC